MTFSVIELGDVNQKVVGTIWAEAESEAQVIASNLLNHSEKEHVVIRRDEDRELPLKPFN